MAPGSDSTVSAADNSATTDQAPAIPGAWAAGVGPQPAGDDRASRGQLIQQIVDALTALKADALNTGDIKVNYNPADMTEGATVTNFTDGKDIHGTACGAYVTMVVERLTDDGKPVITCTASSMIVTAPGIVADDGSMMLRFKHITIEPSAASGSGW